MSKLSRVRGASFVACECDPLELEGCEPRHRACGGNTTRPRWSSFSCRRCRPLKEPELAFLGSSIARNRTPRSRPGVPGVNVNILVHDTAHLCSRRVANCVFLGQGHHRIMKQRLVCKFSQDALEWPKDRKRCLCGPGASGRWTCKLPVRL